MEILRKLGCPAPGKGENVVGGKYFPPNLDFAKGVGSPRMHRAGILPPPGGGRDCWDLYEVELTIWVSEGSTEKKNLFSHCCDKPFRIVSEK